MMQPEALSLTQTWDKTFAKSDAVDHRKVTFVNRCGNALAADLYDGGKTNAIPFDKPERFFASYLK